MYLQLPPPDDVESVRRPLRLYTIIGFRDDTETDGPLPDSLFLTAVYIFFKVSGDPLEISNIMSSFSQHSYLHLFYGMKLFPRKSQYNTCTHTAVWNHNCITPHALLRVFSSFHISKILIVFRCIGDQLRKKFNKKLTSLKF